MSKKWIVCIIAAALLFTTACGKKIGHYGVEAKTDSFENLQEMEEYCAVIVRVTREDQEKPIITNSDGMMVSGYTFSQARVEEIYKDDTEMLKTGDSIRILENEVFNGQNRTVYHIGGYNMMVAGKEYLLFLNKASSYDREPYYYAVGIDFGTVSLEKDNRTAVRYDIGGTQTEDFSVYQPIWDAAIEKYIQSD